MLVGDLANFNEGHSLHYSVDPRVEALTFTTTQAILSDRAIVVENLVRRVAWAYDYDLHSDMIERYAAPRFPQQ